MKEKRIFLTLLIILALSLPLLPFLTTLSSLLTALIQSSQLYRVIEDFILPWETRMIVVVMNRLGIEAAAGTNTVSILREGRWQRVLISWNCIGWQSLAIFLLSLLVGLQGPYTMLSRLECFLIGLAGTFLVNILRISLATLLIVYLNQIPATVSHDYFSVFVLVGWLFVFWWFSYGYVLKEK